MTTTDDAPTTASTPDATGAPPKRRRALKILAGVLLLLVLLAALAPYWTPPIIRGFAVSAINEQLAGTAEIESLSWSWGGNVRVEGLRVTDRAGQPVVRVASVDASVDVPAALSGDIRATLVVESPEADLRRQPDGRLNVESIVEAPSEPSPDEPKESQELPRVAATVEVRGARVRFHAPDGTSELRDVQVSFDLKGLDQPAPFRVAAQVQGPAGPGGAVELSGDVLLAPDGVLRPEAPRVNVDYTLDDLQLAALAPMAALFAPAPAASGRIAGKGHWQWQGGLVVQGQTTIELAGVRVAALAPGQADIVVPDTQLSAQAQLDDQGAGRQTLSLKSGELLDLSWDGAVAGLLGDAPSVDGKLALTGQLGGWLDLLREPLALQPGVDVSGGLRLDTSVRAALAKAGPESVSVEGTLRLQDVAARDAQGQPLDLGGLGALEMRWQLAAQPLAGAASLDALELKAGPVALSLSGRVEGLPRDGAPLDPAALAVQGGKLDARADLAQLVAALAPLVDLGGLTARGTLIASGTASGSAGAVTAKTNLALTSLALQRPDGLDVSLAGLVVDTTIAADERAIHVQQLTTRWQPVRATGRELPGGELQASATYTPGTGAAEATWTLSTPLVSGEGQLSATGLAASADSAGAAGSAAAGARIDTSLRLSGQVEPVRAWLASTMPELAQARGDGAWSLALAVTREGTRTNVQPTFELRGAALSGYVVDGRELPLSQADVDFSARLAVDESGGGSLKAEELSLRAPGLELSASGSAAGFMTDPQAATGDATLAWSLQPDVLTSRAGALLGGLGLAGQPLQGSTRLVLAPSGATAEGEITGAELAVTLPADAATGTPARTLVQRELAIGFDLTAGPWPKVDAVDIRRAEFRSSTAQASLEGRLEGVATPESSSADLHWRLDSELARLVADLGPLLALPDWDAQGAAHFEGALKGDAGRLALTADGSIAKLHLVVPVPPPASSAPAGAAAAAKPIVIDEPTLGFGLSADVLVEPLDVTLSRASIASSFLRGQVSGQILALRSGAPRLAPLEGTFTYVPGTLGALLSPWLPVQWSGTEEQPLRFRVEGEIAGVDPQALLASMTADATVGLGQIAVPGLVAGGQVAVASKAGQTHVTGKLSANGGQLDLDAKLDLRPAAAGVAPQSTFGFGLSNLKITQELAELLARLHPLFAGTAGKQLATLSGTISADLDATWAGPLPLKEPAGGWLSVLGHALSATGKFQADGVSFASSALLGDMLSAINLPGSTEMSLAPISFRVEQGRLSYAEPWVLNLAGQQTSFTGSVGLDLSLDLQWNVPVTDKLIEKHKFLESLAGQSISVPITGTATAPVLGWTDALKDLAERAAQGELEKRLKDKLGGLPAIPGLPGTGGGDADKPGATPALSAEQLLANADKLWDEGKQAEAQPLYQELIDKHKLTMVYALNKKRIKDRAEGK